MSELKAGDRVRRKGLAQPFGEAIGTLKPNELSQYASAKFLIEFDSDLDCGHDCYGQTADNRGWLVYCTDLWEKVMDKLKVGDWIEVTGHGYKPGEAYSDEPEIGSRGTVVHVSPDGLAAVVFEDGQKLHDCGGITRKGCGWFFGQNSKTPYVVVRGPHVKDKEPEKLNLKVGDIVESLGQEPGGPKAGLRGTVVFIDCAGSAAVDFPDANNLHGCGGRIPGHRGWWVFHNDMNKFKVVAEKFDDAPVAEPDKLDLRVGTIIEVIDKLNDFSPAVGSRATVIKLVRDEAVVEFSQNQPGITHYCDGTVPSGRGWYVSVYDKHYKVIYQPDDETDDQKVVVKVIGPDEVEIGGLTWSKKEVIEIIAETKDDIEACEKEIKDSEQELIALRAEQEVHQLALKKLNEYVAPEPVIGAGSWVRMRDNLPVGRLVGEIGRVCDVFNKGYGVGYTVEFPQRYDCLDPDGDKPGRKLSVHSKYVELA